MTKKELLEKNKKEVLEKIRTFLQVGYSFHKSCILGGVPIRSAYRYYENDEKFKSEVELLRNSVSVLARQNIAEAIQNKDVKMSLEWLDRVDKDEFSKRLEITGKEGENLFNPIEILFDLFKNNLPDKDKK